MTKCEPPTASESCSAYVFTLSFDWKLETFREKPSARSTPASRSGCAILAGSSIQSGLPASR
ncbi:hypothetical protein SBADM41S_06409 [Streptomyces badius]